MSQVENDEFARIALGEGFCTPAQIERCLGIQSSTSEHLSLGQSLLREGFITPEQYSRILVLLRQGYKKERDTAALMKVERQSQEDRLLSRVVLREGFVTAKQLQECQDRQDAGSIRSSLAEILVSGGYLEAPQVESILARLVRKEMFCPSCSASFSVLGVPFTRVLECPRCRGNLAEGPRG